MGHLTETWEIHNSHNLYLVSGIDEGNLADTAVSGGRTVGEQFAHMHNVRLMWLKVALPASLDSLNKIDKGTITKDLLLNELKNSGAAVFKLLENAETDGKVKGFKPHATAFLGYLISHESHHRGQIMLCLKQSGHPADKKLQFGLWEWGTKK